MSAPAPRELVASVNDREVGVLRERASLWSFQYSPSWIAAADAYDLSPALQRATREIIDGASIRPVQWFFDNLLPEGEARKTLSREAKIESADAFGLLAYYGRESAGALTLMARGDTLPPADYLPLTDEDLSTRIRKRPKQSLVANAPKKMSNAGAQDKLAVVVRGGKLFQPVGNAISTHLLKPDHVNRDEYPNSVANEYFTMRLAAGLGLDVPAVEIRYVPDPVYLIERFDRTTTSGDTRRSHVIDACQLLGLDRSFKYEQSTVDTLMRCVELCENRARSRQSLLELALFNLLTGNSDAHLKNISFHVGPRGIAIAPFYDLVATEAFNTVPGNDERWPRARLSMPIGAAETFDQVNVEAFHDFSKKLGIAPTAYRRTLQQFTEKIEPVAKELYEEFEALKIPERIVREGQLKMLRSIREILVKEMVAKLRS